jgi:hypothetical protein
MKRNPSESGTKNLTDELAELRRLDPSALKQRRVLYRTEAPAHIGQSLLLQAVAYRLQERVLGGLQSLGHFVIFKKGISASFTGTGFSACTQCQAPSTITLPRRSGIRFSISAIIVPPANESTRSFLPAIKSAGCSIFACSS